MMRRLLAAVAALVMGTIGVTAQQPSTPNIEGDFLFHQLFDAQMAKNYGAFVEHGTTELKAALTKTQFDASSDLLIARAKGGCDIHLLGELDQRGLRVYLFKLKFKDGGDDMLGTMALKNGEVAGIYFH